MYSIAKQRCRPKINEFAVETTERSAIMTVKRHQLFGRIMQHRIDSAKVFPHMGEKGKEFTDFIQGAPYSKDEIAKHTAKAKMSFAAR